MSWTYPILKKLNKKWFAPAAHLLIIDAISGNTAVSIGMIKPYPFWAIIFRWFLYEFCFLHNRTINLRWGRIFLRNALFCRALSWEKWFTEIIFIAHSQINLTVLSSKHSISPVKFSREKPFFVSNFIKGKYFRIFP